MRGDRQAKAVRLVAGGLDIVRGHLHFARLTLLGRVEHAAGYHELYKVGLRLGDLAHILGSFRSGGRFIGKGARHVSAGDGDGHVSGEDTRAYALAGIDVIAQLCVEVLYSADAAQRGHAAEELGLDIACAHLVGDLLHERVRGHELDKLLDVGLFLFRLAAAGDMDVHVYKTWHDIAAVEVYDAAAVGARSLMLDALDLIAVGEEDHVLYRGHVLFAGEDDAVYIGCSGALGSDVFLHFHIPLYIFIFSSSVPTREASSSSAPGVNGETKPASASSSVHSFSPP